MCKLVLVLCAAVVVAVASVEISCNDPNAAKPPRGCNVNCNRFCVNYLTNRRDPCPKIACNPNKCGCIEGTYYDKNKKKCVLGKYCTPQN